MLNMYIQRIRLLSFVKNMDDVANEVFGKNIFLAAKTKKRKPAKKKLKKEE